VSAPEAPSRAARVVTAVAVLLVATVAAVVSFVPMSTLAPEAGEGWRALLLPCPGAGWCTTQSMGARGVGVIGRPGGVHRDPAELG